MRIQHFKQFCLFSAIGTVAFLPLLVLPAMIGVLVDESGLSESFAGWSSSLNFLGGALVAIAMSFRMHSLDLRSVARIGLALAAITDLASTLAAPHPVAFLCARFLAGVGAGVAMADQRVAELVKYCVTHSSARAASDKRAGRFDYHSMSP